MNFNSFLYRQKQRVRYHLAKDRIGKIIAEYNRNSEQIIVGKNEYFIKRIGLKLPKTRFDYVFLKLDLLVNNALNLNGKYQIEGDNLIFIWDNFKINIGSSSELFVINEIFVEKCYNFKYPENLSVIDIGMNVGLASIYFSSLPHVNNVYSFEPFKPTYKQAQNNFELNPSVSQKIQPHNYGLGMSESILTIPYNPENSGINTMILSPEKGSKELREEKIEIREASSEIERLIKENPKDKFIIKMDTEGAEYEIFENLSKKNLDSRIVGMIIEWHFKGPEKIETYLLKEGFKFFSVSINPKSGLIYAFR